MSFLFHLAIFEAVRLKKKDKKGCVMLFCLNLEHVCSSKYFAQLIMLLIQNRVSRECLCRGVSKPASVCVCRCILEVHRVLHKLDNQLSSMCVPVDTRRPPHCTLLWESCYVLMLVFKMHAISAGGCTCKNHTEWH